MKPTLHYIKRHLFVGAANALDHYTIVHLDLLLSYTLFFAVTDIQ